jgi:hypothetical protein
VKAKNVVTLKGAVEGQPNAGDLAIIMECGAANVAQVTKPKMIHAVHLTPTKYQALHGDEEIMNDVETKLKWLKDSCQGVQQMHEQDIVWIDCKPENFVLFNQGMKMVTKCIDFDSCVMQGQSIVGYTPKSMPPELAACLKGKVSDEEKQQAWSKFEAAKSYDMWCIGLYVWFLWFGTEFNEEFYGYDSSNTKVFNEDKCIDWLNAGDVQETVNARVQKVKNDKVQSVLEGLLCVDPAKRTTISALLDQSLFNTNADATKGIQSMKCQLSGLESRVNEIENRMQEMNSAIKACCNSQAGVERYIEEQISEVKEFIAEVVKKLPVPTQITTKKGGILGTKTVTQLWFVCEETGEHVIVETSDWNKWVKVGFAAIKTGASICRFVAAGDPSIFAEAMGSATKMFDACKHLKENADAEGLLTKVGSAYQSWKSRDDPPFDEHITEPFLTSKESDELIDGLKKANFFDTMAYDAQTHQWVHKPWIEEQKAKRSASPVTAPSLNISKEAASVTSPQTTGNYGDLRAVPAGQQEAASTPEKPAGQ